MQGKGQQAKEQPEALTVWLAAADKDQQQGLLPFGWLLAEIDPDDAPAPERPALAEACRAMGAALAENRRRLAARHAATQQARVQIEAEQREAREAEQRRVEEAATRARKDAEEAERKKRLSPAMAEVDDFVTFMRARHEAMRGGKTAIGQADYQQAQALARKAASPDWSADEKRAAADAIETWLPQVVRIDARDTRKKLWLAALRGAA